MSKVSMLPIAIVDDAEGGVLGGVHYGDWKHTNFRRWTRPSLNKCFSITYTNPMFISTREHQMISFCSTLFDVNVTDVFLID